MTDTLKNIKIPPNKWVNLYEHPVISGAGIVVGDVLRVNLIYGSNVYLNAGTDEPDQGSGFTPLYGDGPYINEATDTGGWIISRDGDALINVNKEG